MKLAWKNLLLPVAALVAFAILIKLPPYWSDILLYKEWAKVAANNGNLALLNDGSFNYLPSFLGVIGLFNLAQSVINLLGYRPEFIDFWRTFFFVIHLGLAGWLTAISKPYLSSVAQKWLPWLLIFNPVFIWIGWVWGQTDLVMIIPWVISFIYLVQKKYVWFILLTLFVVLLKPTGILLLPFQALLLVVQLLRESKYKHYLQYGFHAFFVGTLILLPFLPALTDRIANFSGGTNPHWVTWNSYNAWFLVKDAADMQLLFHGLSYRVWSGLLVLVIMIYITTVLLNALRKQHDDKRLLTLYLSYAVVFTYTINLLLTDMHERYWDFALAPLILAAVLYRPWRPILGALSITFLLNMVLVFPSSSPLFNSLADEAGYWGYLVAWAHLIIYPFILHIWDEVVHDKLTERSTQLVTPPWQSAWNWLKKRFKEHTVALTILLATWGAYFTILFSRIIKFQPEGLFAGHQNVWGDWALHIGIANIFAFKTPALWFAYHPYYAGGKFTYPFVANFISGMLMKIGISLPTAFIVPSIITALALLVGLYYLFYTLLKSQKQALAAISLFMLSSGIGFANFVSDWLQNPSLEAITYPIKEYSRFEIYEWGTGNVVVGLLLPQRAFLLGMTVAVWALLFLLTVLLRDNLEQKKQRLYLIVAGVLAGVLPIIHPHSFIIVVIVTALICLSSYKKWRLLLYYVVPASVLSLTLYAIFIRGGIENSDFVTWVPGWTAKGGLLGWLKMWWILWGAMIPAAIAGWFLLPKKTELPIKAFFLSFVPIFILANLFVFQPIRWDNTKLFWWVYLALAGLAAYLLAYLWHKKLTGKVTAVMLTIVLTFTGTLELIRLWRVDMNTYEITSTEDINLGAKIRKQTDTEARFLTAPTHNHPAMMWGVRPILLGYTAWAWNYGFNYQQREIDAHTMYKGGEAAEQLMIQYEVSYVAVGPAELNEMEVDEAYFSQRFPVAFSNENYKIYDTRSLLSAEVIGKPKSQ